MNKQYTKISTQAEQKGVDVPVGKTAKEVKEMGFDVPDNIPETFFLAEDDNSTPVKLGNFSEKTGYVWHKPEQEVEKHFTYCELVNENRLEEQGKKLGVVPVSGWHVKYFLEKGFDLSWFLLVDDVESYLFYDESLKSEKHTGWYLIEEKPKGME